MEDKCKGCKWVAVRNVSNITQDEQLAPCFRCARIATDNYEKERTNIVDPKTGSDEEWFATWFKCPMCDETHINLNFKYCPDCGVELNWNKLKEEDNHEGY